jgi:hypothetical protein
MTSYVNPTHGNDATAQHGSRRFPWRTYPAAEAALKALRAEALAADPQSTEVYKLVLTHKPLPPDEASA